VEEKEKEIELEGYNFFL